MSLDLGYRPDSRQHLPDVLLKNADGAKLILPRLK